MFNQVQNVFLVGIKGVAMANVAIMLKQMGKHVSGSDSKETFPTDETLNKNDIPILVGFEPKHLPENVDLLIYTGAHQGTNNPQVKEAVKRGIKTLSLAETTAELAKMFNTVMAVCGCHGKTTTSSFLAYMLLKLGYSPSYLIGTATFGDYTGGGYNGSDYFVAEADEYAINPPENKTPKFHLLHAKYAIATNIDYDHPDVYANIDETRVAFLTFFEQTLAGGPRNKLFVCSDDHHLSKVVSKLPRERYATYGQDQYADLRIEAIKATEDYTKFNLVFNQKNLGTFFISLFGEKNVLNVAGALLCLLELGLDAEQMKDVTQGFTGAKRRMELKSKQNNTYLFDDYAHHPNEIEASVGALRMRFPERRLILIFQPHTFSRTKMLEADFIAALAKADYSLVLPIYGSARENSQSETYSSLSLMDRALKAGIENIEAFEDKKSVIYRLASIIQPGDVICTMGAGDVYKYENDIIDLMKLAK